MSSRAACLIRACLRARRAELALYLYRGVAPVELLEEVAQLGVDLAVVAWEVQA